MGRVDVHKKRNKGEVEEGWQDVLVGQKETIERSNFTAVRRKIRNEVQHKTDQQEKSQCAKGNGREPMDKQIQRLKRVWPSAS